MTLLDTLHLVPPEIYGLYLVVGVIAGLLSGMLGVGGGIIIVPILAFLFVYTGNDSEYLMQQAVGTSLATIVLTSISSAWAHHRYGAVKWSTVRRLAPSMAVGALGGIAVANRISSDMLQLVFGAFLTLAALHMLGLFGASTRDKLPGLVSLSATGLLMGCISAVVGIGGGTLSVPYLTMHSVSIRNAIATAVACGLPLATVGAVGFLLSGFSKPGLPLGSVGFVYLPAFAGIVAATLLFAPVGAFFAHRVPRDSLKKMFSLFLASIGIWMLHGH